MNSPRSFGSALLLLSQLATAAPPLAQAPSDTIAVAGLLGGDALVPLAQFSSGRWHRTWPGPDEQLERVVPALKDIPSAWYPKARVPTTWFLFTEHVHGAPVSVSAPVLADAHCQSVWGLATRLQGFGHETTALALNRPTGAAPFEEFTPEPAFETALVPFLTAAFEKAVAAAPISAGSESAANALSQSPQSPSMRVACAGATEAAKSPCHFSASRTVGPAADQGVGDCPTMAVVQGWYSSTEHGLLLLQAALTVTDCDAVELRTTMPLLHLQVGTRSFVVAREHGYEDESFVVFEHTGSRLIRLLDRPGGGC